MARCGRRFCGWRCGQRWWLCGRAARWSSLLLVAAVVGLAAIVRLPLEGWSMETGKTVLWCVGVVGNDWWWKGTAGMLWFCEGEFGDGCGAVGWRSWVCSG
jgi:hypothetical protein